MNKQQEPHLRFKGFAGEWQRATIGELGEIVTGNTPTTSENDNYGNNGLLWVTPTDIKEPITIKTAKQLSEKGKKSARCLPPNSILITCIASIGKNTLIETYGSCNQQINALIPKRECNPYFLLTLSELWSIQMKKIAGSGTMDIVNKTQFSEIRTKLPSSEEQSTIGNFFRRLDSQIAENRTVLEKSRQLKKAMLAKMFPTNGEKIPKIRFKGFEGEWKCRKLGDLMNVTSVKRIHQSDWTNEGVRFLRARDIVAFNKGEKIEEPLFISKEKYNEYSEISGKVKIGDLLVTGVGTIGVPYLIEDEDPLYFKDGNVIWFQNENKIGGLFFYYSFLNNFIQDFIIETAGIGTVGTYTIDTGKKTPIFLPPTKSEQTAIGNFFRQLDETIALQSAEVEKLNQLKKGLLAAMLV